VRLRLRDRITGRTRTAGSARPDGEPVAFGVPGEVDALLWPGFLTDGQCAGLCAEMDVAPRFEGSAREAARPGAGSVDPGGRRASECVVSDETVRDLGDRICAVVPQLARHFGQELGECEMPHFVAYEPGDFYRPYRDIYPDVELPEPLARRRLSLVVFLNDSHTQSEPAASVSAQHYEGGVLRLCSHEREAFDPRLGWDVPARRGHLVAFRADTWHEVSPITNGRRYTIVAILLAPKR
jgi:SM-20-related protein